MMGTEADVPLRSLLGTVAVISLRRVRPRIGFGPVPQAVRQSPGQHAGWQLV